MSGTITHRSALLDGLSVVALEGETRDNATPARRAVIYADSQDRLVRVDFTLKQRFFIERCAVEDLPHLCAEPLLKRLTPRPDAFFFVFGFHEIAHMEAIQTCPGFKTNAIIERVFRFFREHKLFDDDIGILCLGGNTSHFAWLTTQELATEMERRIAHVAHKEILYSLRSRNEHQAREYAWWLFRAAQDERDRMEAAAALKITGDVPMMEILLEAARLAGTQIDGRLEQRYEALLAEVGQTEQSK